MAVLCRQVAGKGVIGADVLCASDFLAVSRIFPSARKKENAAHDERKHDDDGNDFPGLLHSSSDSFQLMNVPEAIMPQLDEANVKLRGSENEVCREQKSQ